MSIEALIAQAAELAVKHLVPSAAGGVAKVAGDVWGWITAKTPEKKKAVVESIAADPEDEGAEDMLKGLLKGILKGNPALEEELAALLKDAPPAGTSQTVTLTGDNGKVGQISGNNSKITID